MYASMRKHHTENTRRHHADLRRLHLSRRARDLRAAANLGERDGASLREDGGMTKEEAIYQLRNRRKMWRCDATNAETGRGVWWDHPAQRADRWTLTVVSRLHADEIDEIIKALESEKQ